MSRVLSPVLIAVVMLVVSSVGLLKLLDLQAFESALGTWSLLPSAFVPAIVVIVPSIELAAGGLWLCGLWRRSAALTVFVLLLVFTVAYAVHLRFGAPPACGCFGLLARYRWANSIASHVVVRNLVLLALLGSGLALERWRDKTSSTTCSPPQCRRRCSGFTLVETLLVTALIAILAAQWLPSLAAVRLSARMTASSAQIRSHGAVFAMYTVDYKDFMPYVTDPDADYTILRAGDLAVPVVYFEAVNRWHIGIAPHYYGDDPFNASFFFPGRPKLEFTTYNYSQTFLADPSYWNEKTRSGPDQWRAVGAHEVTFPGAKALLVDGGSEAERRRNPGAIGGSPVITAFVDGSVRQISFWDFTRGYPRETGWRWHGTFNSIIDIGMHTIDGVRGRDVE